MKAARNSFHGGLKTDKDPLTKHEGEYVDALNIRLESDTSGTNYSVINVQGNKKETSIPNVPNVLVLEPNFLDANGDEYLTDGWNQTIKLTLQDTVGGGPFLVQGNSLYAGENSWLVFFNRIKEELETGSAWNAFNLRVSMSGLRITITSDTYNVISYDGISNTGEEWINSTLNTYSTVTTQKIIGWVSINDAFYIYTTMSTANPGAGFIWKLVYDKITFDYTWSIVYASDDLKFSTKHPIANPTGIEAVDEGDGLVRVAWTDNYNPLRVLNVESPNAMAYTIGMLAVHDGTTNPIPTFRTTRVGGNLKTGVYQIAYRLRSDDTGYTLMSQHSSVISIVQDSEDIGSWAGYEGNDSGEFTAKSLEFEFDIVDTSYPYLEIFSLYRANSTDVPEVRLVSEIPIYNHKIAHTITGYEEQASFTYEEFLNLYNPFTHCKTITQKDNILFAANVREDTFDIEFDPRAYAYGKNGSTYAELNQDDPLLDQINPSFEYYGLQSNGLTPGGTGPNVSYRFTKRRHSADLSISPNAEFNADPPASLSTTSTMRRYISTNAGAQWPDNASDPDYVAAYAGDQNPSYSDGISNQLGRPNYYGFANYHGSPWESANFRGYKRGEIYRFAFVPVKNGQEGRAKWIADIRIPHYTDVYPDAPDPEDQSFELIHSEVDGHQSDFFMHSIGLEFTVDVSSIASQIDGFKIKRVEREEGDKSILASGIIGTTQRQHVADFPGAYMQHVTGFHHIKYGSGLALRDGIGMNNDLTEHHRPRTCIESGIPETGHVAFYSPDVNFADSFEFKGGDKIRQEALLYPSYSSINNEALNPSGVAPIGTLNVADSTENENTTVSKLTRQLNMRDYPNQQGWAMFNEFGVDINEAKVCESGASVEVGGLSFHNRSVVDKHGGQNSAGTFQLSLGAKMLAMSVGGDSDFIIPMYQIMQNSAYSNPPLPHLAGFKDADGNRYWSTQVRRYADYIRPLKAQYGGATYAARSKNKYIDCGNYIPVKAGDTVKTFKVFGGDTFINFMSIVTFRRNLVAWVDSSQAVAASELAAQNDVTDGAFEDAGNDIQDDVKEMFNYVEYFPVESSVNVDLRQGYTYDKNWSDLNAPGLEMNGWGYPDIGNANVSPNWDRIAWETFAAKNLLQAGDSWDYNYAYSSEENLAPSFPLPLTGEEATEFTERIYASDVKIKGEIVDSWKRFRTQSFIDINGAHGPINAIINFMDRINVIQDRAIGIAAVNERQVSVSASGESTVLGSSGILPRYDYVSTTMGTKHQFGIVMSPNSLYFFDVSDGVLYKFTGDKINPISQVGEMSQFFRNNAREHLLLNDNPIEINTILDLPNIYLGSIGITGTYDFKYNEVFLTFHNKKEGVTGNPFTSFTICFNENGNVFSSFNSAKPTLYLNDKENYFTPGPVDILNDKSGDLYIHNEGNRGEFYDTYHDSYVEFVVNDAQNVSKIFTNLEWESEVFDTNGNNIFDATVSSINTSNAYQIAPELTTFKRRFRTWRATLPREVGTKARLRDHFLKTKYSFTNSDNKKFVLSGVTTIYDGVAY